MKVANELVFEDPPTEETPTSIPSPRTSDPNSLGHAARRLLSTVPENFALLPALPAMAKAGVDALGTRITTPGSSITDEFMKEIQDEGGTKQLMGLALRGQDAVREAFNVPGDPYTTTDQIASLLGNILPIPGPRGMGAITKPATGALALTTNLVKANSKAQFARRALGQGAVFTGVEQGVRAISDHPQLPTMFSDAALGKSEFDLSFEDPPVNGLMLEDIDKEDIELSNDPERDAFLKMDKAVQDQKNTNDAIVFAAAAAGIVGSYALMRRMQAIRQQQSLPSDLGGDTAFGRPEDPGFMSKLKDSVANLKGNLVDMQDTINKAVLHADPNNPAVTDPIISSIDARVGNDYISMAQQAARGLWAGLRNFSGESLHQIELDFRSLPPNLQDTWLKGMAAEAEMQVRSQTGTPTTMLEVGLWNKAANRLYTHGEVDAFRNAMWSNPILSALAERYARIGRDSLNYQRHVIGTLSDTQVDNFIEQSSLFGRQMYIPSMEASYLPSASRRLGTRMGLFPDQGMTEIIDAVGHVARSRTAGGGVMSPLDPFTSMRMHINQVMRYTNEQALKNDAYTSGTGLRGLRFNRTTGQFEVPDPNTPNAHVPLGATGYVPPVKSSMVRLIGASNPDDPINIGGVQVGKFTKMDDPEVDRLLGPMQDQAKYDFLRNSELLDHVEFDGITYHYLVHPALKASTDLNPGLSRFMKFNNFWKNVFTQGTTGTLSLFAPAAAAFSAQLTAMTKAATTGKIGKSLVEVNYDTVKGAYRLFKRDTAEIWSDFAARGIARNLSQGNAPSPALQSLKNKLQRSINDTTLNAIRSTTGRTATSYGSTTRSGTFSDIVDAAVPAWKDSFGADFATSMGRTWVALNRAFQEGTATGTAIRALDQAGNLNPETVRGVIFDVKNLTGDVNRRGSSNLARLIKHSVPFSGPMIQSFHAIAMAMKHAGYAKGAALIGGVLAMPTMAEFAVNQVMMLWGDVDENGDQRLYYDGSRFWTQHDYYWNGLNEQQRVSNAFVAIPGVAPWHFPTMPISPEWSLGRGIVIEAMDALTSASNVGNRKDIATNGAHVFASFSRIFDFPLPPWAAATFTALSGKDLRIGLQTEVDPKTGLGFTVSTSRDVFSGQKTGPFAHEVYANSIHNQMFASIMQDIFGAVGSAYLAVSDAFFAGNQKGGFFGGIEDATEAVGDQVSRNLRIATPLLGKSIHNNKDNALNTKLHAKRSALRMMTRDILPNQLGQGLIDFNTGMQVAGDTLPPIQDPVYNYVVRSSKAVSQSVDRMQEGINKLQRKLHQTGVAPDLSYIERVRLRDQLNNEINAKRALQLREIEKHEAKMSEELSKYLGRKVELTFDNAKKRPNVGDYPVLPVPPTGAPQFTPRPSGQ